MYMYEHTYVTHEHTYEHTYVTHEHTYEHTYVHTQMHTDDWMDG